MKSWHVHHDWHACVGGGGEAAYPSHSSHPAQRASLHVGLSVVCHGATHHVAHSSLGGGGDLVGGGGGDLRTKPAHSVQPAQPANTQVAVSLYEPSAAVPGSSHGAAHHVLHGRSTGADVVGGSVAPPAHSLQPLQPSKVHTG